MKIHTIALASALLILAAASPTAGAYSTMTQTTAQSCGGTQTDSDGAVDLALAMSLSASSGTCNDGTPTSAIADATADIAAAEVAVFGEGVGPQEQNGSFAQASFSERLTVEGVPAGLDSIQIEVTLSLEGVPPAPAFYNSGSFDASVNAQVAPGQVRLQACSGDLCPGNVDPIRNDTLTEVVTLNRNGLGEFGFITIFMDARFAIAATSASMSGHVSVELTDVPEATLISESGLFGQTPDADEDGVPDAADNCIETANGDQRDTDADGFGNACDADLNNDCIVNVVDLGILRSRFFSNDADADFDGDGVVNVVDLGIMRSLFFQAPGPSGAATLCSP